MDFGFKVTLICSRFYHLISPAAPYSANLLITTPFWAMLWIVTPLYILAWALPHLGLLMPFCAEHLFILLALIFWLHYSSGISTLYRCCLCFAEVSFRMILGYFFIDNGVSNGKFKFVSGGELLYRFSSNWGNLKM